MEIYHEGSFRPFSGALDLLRFSPLSLQARVRLGFAMWRLSRTTDWRRFTTKSARTWLLENAGEEAVAVIWEPLLKAKFHDAYRDISMAWLWARIHIRSRSRTSLVGPEQLGYFAGGFATLTRALEESIRTGGTHVRNSTEVCALHRREDGRIEVETANDKNAYDQVLVTAPSPVFARMLSADDVATEKYRQTLASTRYLAAMTLIFSSTQCLTEAYWTSIVQPDNPFLVLVHHTALVGASEFGGRYVYYLGQYLPETHPEFMGEDEAVIEHWLSCLRQMIPEFRRECVQELRLFKFRYAQHVVTTDHAAKIPDIQGPWAGLYLANFSQTFPEDRGTNFAIRDGRAVAALMDKLIHSH
ncbi:FAD-dependent oxidoreductase [Ottowia caeni]|uniref:FAD-dependent oxidoreductase n=1 Tax=Ottowia caeni TaxID=2870339 RepID=UPI003D74C234